MKRVGCRQQNPTVVAPIAGLCRHLLSAALCAIAALPRPGVAKSTEPFEADTPGLCLAVRGAIADDAVPMRLASPPLSGQTGSLMPGAASRGHLLRPSAQASAPGPRGASSPEASRAATMFDALLAPSSAAAAQLDEGSNALAAGRHAEAERQLASCAKQAAQKADSLLEAACHNNLGVLHALRGDWQPAREALARALRLYETPRDTPANLPAPPGMSALQGALGDPLAEQEKLLKRLPPEIRAMVEAQLANSRPELEAAARNLSQGLKEGAATQWRAFETVDARRGIERTTLNLGNLEAVAGRLDEAERLLQRAVDSRPANEAAACKAAAENDLARLHFRLGRPAGAGSDGRRRAAAPRSEAPSGEADASIVDEGAVRLVFGRAAPADPSTAMAAGSVATAQRSPPADASLESIPVYGETSGLFDDGTLARLQAEASRASPAAAASQAWRRLALRAAAGRRADLEFSAHAALLRVHAERGEPATATYHGKRAIDLVQAMRAALERSAGTGGGPALGLSREARRSFLRDRRQVYTRLAQLLLDQQRLAEGESVLQLLKEDEGQQFQEGAAGVALGSLALDEAEQVLRRQDEDHARRLRELETARVDAVAKLPYGAGIVLAANPQPMRLQLGLGLPELAEQLRRQPPVAADERMRAVLVDVRDFLVGPQQRVDRFLTHLIEDAPRFEPPADARQMAQLVETRQRLPALKAEWAPLLRDIQVDAGAGFSVKVRRSDEPRPPQETELLTYAVAEPMDQIARSLRDAGRLDAAIPQGSEEALQRASKAASPAAPGGDTLKLLASLPKPTALLYYLPGEDRLDALLVTPGGRRHVRLGVPRAELNAQIDDLLKQLRDPFSNPLPAAQAMYRRLYAPLAEAVTAGGAQVLALSLADRLRFLPFAALHDGNGWLVERYALALHPGGALAGRLKPASARWQVAAFGASQGDAEFPPLLNVRGEIDAVVKPRDGRGGVLPGEAWLDQGFTAGRLRAAVAGEAQVLHIASHFKFTQGNALASYLLLGDGGRLNLRDLSGPDYRFRRTELVTLSACETGISADDDYGQEVDGLAALLMSQGAPSVLASLWKVDDRSTATLMSTLYRLHEERSSSRVLALQQAQLAMIRAAAGATGLANGSTPPGGGGLERIRLPGDAEPAPRAADAVPAALGQAHPFHWAPFVLMGNWL